MNENCCNVPPQYNENPTPFFGQLLHVFTVKLPPATELDPHNRTLHAALTYILACIHRCEVNA
jgi:hypothetical protein